MNVLLSKPLFLCLCASIVASLVVKLSPVQAGDVEEEVVVEFSGVSGVLEDDNVLPAKAVVSEATGRTLEDLSVGFVPYTPPLPPVEPVKLVPQKPVVPNPNFSYLGKLDEGEKIIAFIGSGDNVETLSVGEKIDYNWRIEKITDNGVVLTYLPLNEKRNIFANER